MIRNEKGERKIGAQFSQMFSDSKRIHKLIAERAIEALNQKLN
jgi:hypothetical protein